MPHGGRRPNAGRKAGRKNRLNKKLAEAVAELGTRAAEGQAPLEFFLEVMRDKMNDLELRLEAGKAAAVYVHKRQPQDVNLDAKGLTEPKTTVLVCTAPPKLLESEEDEQGE